jgi:quinol monooxygenase YgiN
MIGIVWEFIVKDEAVQEFQHAYGPGGEWAILFQQHPGYHGTSLLQDTVVKGRFLTVDRWESEELYDRMLRSSRPEYSRLDRKFGALTVSERKLGAWTED